MLQDYEIMNGSAGGRTLRQMMHNALIRPQAVFKLHTWSQVEPHAVLFSKVLVN